MGLQAILGHFNLGCFYYNTISVYDMEEGYKIVQNLPLTSLTRTTPARGKQHQFYCQEITTQPQTAPTSPLNSKLKQKHFNGISLQKWSFYVCI